MLNEGFVANDTRTMIKSEMIKALWRLGPTDPDTWERTVFERLTGGRREDVDWAVEDNQAGYFTWVKSFDQLIGELIEDGHVVERYLRDGGKQLAPVDNDGPLDVAQTVHPVR